MAGLSGTASARRGTASARRGSLAALLLAFAAGLGACDLPEQPDPPVVEIAYLLDAIDGAAPPQPVCEGEATTLTLLFESIALADDGSYGRLQQTRLGEGAPTQQEERGEFVRTDSTIVLEPAAGALVVLTLLDSAGEHVRRIHSCGDTLRYESVPVGED